MCDSNNCNGWTLRAMPDADFSDQHTEEGIESYADFNIPCSSQLFIHFSMQRRAQRL